MSRSSCFYVIHFMDPFLYGECSLCSVLFVFKFFTKPRVMKIFFYVLEVFLCGLCHLDPWFTWNWYLHMVGRRGKMPFSLWINPLPHTEKTIISPFYCSDMLSNEWIDFIFLVNIHWVLLYVKPCAKIIVWIIVLSLHNDSMRVIVLLFSYFTES